VPYPFRLLENVRIPAPTQDVEIFIRHVLDRRLFRVERINLDETNRRFHLLFSQRHIALDGYFEGNKPAYLYWGGIEIIEWSYSTEITRMWAKTPEGWYIQMFSLDENKEMEERFGWLEELSHKIREKFRVEVEEPNEQRMQTTRIDKENITLGELEDRIQAGDKEAIELWEKEISPMFKEIGQAMAIMVERTFENDPSKPFFEMIQIMAKSENPVHRAIIRPYGKWTLKKIKEQGRKLLEAEVAESAKKTPTGGLTDNSIRQVAINTTSVIAGSEYDNLPLKELKHKAARFDAMRHADIDAEAAQASAANPKRELEDTTGWDTTLIEMWNRGYSRDEIALRVYVSKDRVTNRITELRNKFGKKIVPYNKDRKKLLIKS
jgi:hypothetical protein